MCVCVLQERSVVLAGGLVEDQFAVSVRMSTYLVAFVICDFKSVSAVTSSGVQVGTYLQYKRVCVCV